MTREELIALARAAAESHGLDAELVCALCEHESKGWNTWAIRYEPKFFAKYVAPLYTAAKISATEAYARGFSYGLGQVMGQTAREFGFDGEFLSELCDPAVGLEYACRKLAKCARDANGEVKATLLKYNGGGDPNYPELVLSLMGKYEAAATAGEA